MKKLTAYGLAIMRCKMRKLYSIISILIISLLLNSCKINWIDGKSYNVPWWFNFIWMSVFFGIIIISLFRSLTADYRACLKCGHRFKPKWYNSFRALFIGEHHAGGSRLYKCPKCEQKSLMPISYNQDSKDN